LNSTKQYYAPLVCGFGAAVLSIVPGLKSITCCFLIPIAAFLSLYLEQKINKTREPISTRKAITAGLLTGLFAAVFSTFFDILLTLITHSNDFVESLYNTESFLSNYNLGVIMDETIKALRYMAADIKSSGFSLLYTVTILFSNLVTNTIFGLIGGLLGMNYLNKREIHKN